MSWKRRFRLLLKAETTRSDVFWLGFDSIKTALRKAVELERCYLKEGGLNELSFHYRMGRVLEDAGRMKEAIVQYETARQFLEQQPQLPDEEEEMSGEFGLSYPHLPWRTSSSSQQVESDIASRLIRLYQGQGDLEKAYEASQAQAEISLEMPNGQIAVEELFRMAELAGRGESCREWLLSVAANKPKLAAAIFWELSDYEASAQAYAAEFRDIDVSERMTSFEYTLNRFAGVDEKTAILLIEAALEENPESLRFRLARWEIKGESGDDENLKLLEEIVVKDPEFAFTEPYLDTTYQKARLRNHFDLGYRLLRLYQDRKDEDKFQRLALQIAAGEEPFGDLWDGAEKTSYQDGNGWVEDRVTCLSLIVDQINEAALESLAELWKEQRDAPMVRQLQRRMSGGLATGEAPEDVGWANLHEGVRVLASHSNTLCLVRDDSYFYSGFPWGVLVMDHDGNWVTRILLGSPVLSLVAHDGTLWAGTESGLCQIERDTWSVKKIDLAAVVPAEDYPGLKAKPDGTVMLVGNTSVNVMMLDGEELWMGCRNGLQRLNISTLERRVWSPRELEFDNVYPDIERILVMDGFVFVEDYNGLSRYNRESDSFTPIFYGRHRVKLLEGVDDSVLGLVWLDDQRRERVCMINPETLEVEVIRITTGPDEVPYMGRSNIELVGKHEENLIFRAGGSQQHLSWKPGSRSMELFPIEWGQEELDIDRILPKKDGTGEVFGSRPLDSSRLLNETNFMEPIEIVELDGRRRVTAKLADGSRLEFGKDSWGASRNRFLRKVSEDGEVSFLSDRGAGDLLMGDSVSDFFFDEQSGDGWVCTNIGIARLDNDGRVLATYTKQDGMLGNRILGGAVGDDSLYFASGWGRRSGGLIRLHRETGVFTAMVQSDGLPANKLAGVHREGEELEVTFDIEEATGRPFSGKRLFPPIMLSQDALAYRGVEKTVSQEAIQTELKLRKAGESNRKRDPLLSGAIIKESVQGGDRFTLTTRGLIIAPEGDGLPNLVFEQLPTSLKFDQDLVLERLAKKRRPFAKSEDEFLRAMKTENPYLQYDIMFHRGHRIPSDWKEVEPVITEQLQSRLVISRKKAAQILGYIGGENAPEALRPLLKDEDEDVVKAAAFAMGRLGSPAPMEGYRTLLKNNRNSSLNDDVCDVLAEVASPEVMQVLLDYPMTVDNYDGRQKIFARLGKTVREHPALVATLLKAHNDSGDLGPRTNWGSTRFAQEVLAHAGKELLPLLHESLQSKDRVIRSNAARACGSIADPSSIAPLMAALDLESGLSRAAIVWALGELKATESLTVLEEIYQDAVNDGKRHNHTGYRFLQMTAHEQARFESMSSLSSLQAEFNELERGSPMSVPDPNRSEFLLTPDLVIEAVEKIGGPPSFFYALAVDENGSNRMKAAVQLANYSQDNREQTVRTLNALLADSQSAVRAAAAASLLILGETSAQESILSLLKSHHNFEFSDLVQNLERVSDGQKLVFAKDALILRLEKERAQKHRPNSRLSQLIARIP